MYKLIILIIQIISTNKVKNKPHIVYFFAKIIYFVVSQSINNTNLSK